MFLCFLLALVALPPRNFVNSSHPRLDRSTDWCGRKSTLFNLQVMNLSWIACTIKAARYASAAIECQRMSKLKSWTVGSPRWLIFDESHVCHMGHKPLLDAQEKHVTSCDIMWDAWLCDHIPQESWRIGRWDFCQLAGTLVLHGQLLVFLQPSSSCAAAVSLPKRC